MSASIMIIQFVFCIYMRPALEGVTPISPDQDVMHPIEFNLWKIV